ncbi:conserved hypothetical protein [Ricinus communis]|uniref:Uncharacterized protein n=1 Tax=Ricinus communis TaxID=3988 RepID=B9TD49_RICCO|nr:conserved hypothetical protein [Ricinus communis]
MHASPRHRDPVDRRRRDGAPTARGRGEAHPQPGRVHQRGHRAQVRDRPSPRCRG